jgi:hypothetical protein
VVEEARRPALFKADEPANLITSQDCGKRKRANERALAMRAIPGAKPEFDWTVQAESACSVQRTAMASIAENQVWWHFEDTKTRGQETGGQPKKAPHYWERSDQTVKRRTPGLERISPANPWTESHETRGQNSTKSFER